MFVQQGIPMPELQAWIATRPGAPPDCRVDFLWKDQRVVGEFDGREKYRDPAEKTREEERETRLRDLGFVVVRWGWDDVLMYGGQTAVRIRAEFAEAAAAPR